MRTSLPMLSCLPARWTVEDVFLRHRPFLRQSIVSDYCFTDAAHEMPECCQEHKMSKEHLEAKKKILEEKLKWVEEKLGEK